MSLQVLTHVDADFLPRRSKSSSQYPTHVEQSNRGAEGKGTLWRPATYGMMDLEKARVKKVTETVLVRRVRR